MRLLASVVRPPQARGLASHAKRELEEIRVRGIGRPAPEIEGEDLDGKPMRLSDYKGQVVLLDFWGFWEDPAGPCSRTSGRS